MKSFPRRASSKTEEASANLMQQGKFTHEISLLDVMGLCYFMQKFLHPFIFASLCCAPWQVKDQESMGSLVIE